MSARAFFYQPRRRPAELAAWRLWEIRRLWRERAIDPLAADTALRSLRQHPNARIARLAWLTTWQFAEELTR